MRKTNLDKVFAWDVMQGKSWHENRYVKIFIPSSSACNKHVTKKKSFVKPASVRFIYIWDSAKVKTIWVKRKIKKEINLIREKESKLKRKKKKKFKVKNLKAKKGQKGGDGRRKTFRTFRPKALLFFSAYLFFLFLHRHLLFYLFLFFYLFK